MGAASASSSYRAGAQAALSRVKLADVDWTSSNPMRWFPATAPHADKAVAALSAAASKLRAAAPAIGYTALGAGSLYALAKAFKAMSNAETPQNAPLPQESLEAYLRSTS